MANQGPTSQMEGQSSMAEPRSEPSSFIPSVNRRDTMSTVSSEKHSPLPAGIWSLLIHGNCPRCHHHHKATTIQFKIFDDPSKASSVPCEQCGHKWLTIGGHNATQISLLSTQTTDLDNDEIDFRCTLYSVVRSATSIASPAALASVPEASSRAPSRENSIRTQNNDIRRDPESGTHSGTSYATGSPGHAADQGTATPSPILHQSTRKELLSNNVKLTKLMLQDLKRKLKDRFPILKKVHLTKPIEPGPPKTVIAAKGKSPLVEPSQNRASPSTPKVPTQDTAEQSIHDKKSSTLKDAEDVCTPAKSTAQAVEVVKNFDKEAIKHMTPEQRTFWIREQITAFKCRYSRQCTCRHRRASSSLMVDSSTQVHILPPVAFEPPRRHSFEGIGSHLDYYAPGVFFTDTGPLTISATRTSEADTIVESNTVASSRRHSQVDFVPRQRHRSWSPRPTSLINSRQPLQHLAQYRLVARDSMDSIITGGGIRSSSRGGRRRPDRRSLASVAPPTIPSRPDSPEMPSHGAAVASDGANTSRASQELSEAPTPCVNGYPTDDERNRTSASPGDAAHS